MTFNIYEQFLARSIFLLSYDAPSAPITLRPPETHLLVLRTQYLAISGKQKALVQLTMGQEGTEITKESVLFAAKATVA